MKKFLNNKKLIPGAIALLAALGVVNSIGVIGLQEGGFAQVFSSTFFGSVGAGTVHYGVEDNSHGQAVGLTFKQNKLIRITACGGGGGGGGGGRGWEDGDGEGNGGGGGGGGGRGQCLNRTTKIRAGETVRWLVGTGGSGGAGGVIDLFTGGTGIPNEDTTATSGQNGGTTYVSINGVDIMVASGGNGGAYGSNAFDNGVGAGGGWGGSIVPGYASSSWHAGQSGGGQWDNPQIVCGNGGRGGRGETDVFGGDPATSGSPGYSSFNSYDFGGHGGNGQSTFGGGGGGGGPCRWYWYAAYEDNYDNSIRNRGGWGGAGGNGYVTISW